MKTFVCSITFFLIAVVGMQAQEISKNAIGLRLGDNDGFGAEISYQRAIGDNNRLEFDMGWRNNDAFDAIKIAGLYQWVFNIDGGFNWYLGPGGGFVFVNYEDRIDSKDDSDTYLFLAGDIGLEYSFDFPLLLSIDFRPEIGFGNNDDDLDFDIGFGIRYQF